MWQSPLQIDCRFRQSAHPDEDLSASFKDFGAVVPPESRTTQGGIDKFERAVGVAVGVLRQAPGEVV